MGKAATELARANRPALIKSATILKDEALKRLPASKKLRNMGKSGAKIGVRYDIRSDTYAEVKATGPLHILDNATKPHDIARKKPDYGPGSGRGGGVRLSDGRVRRTVKHPGTKGKKTFEKGMEAGKPAALTALRNAHIDAMKRGLAG